MNKIKIFLSYLEENINKWNYQLLFANKDDKNFHWNLKKEEIT